MEITRIKEKKSLHTFKDSTVYREVKSYLRTNSRTELSIIKKVGKGLYCINNNVNDSRQLLFEFKDAITSESKSKGDELLLKLF